MEANTMISYWKDAEGLVRVDEFKKNCIVQVTAPTTEENEFLKDRFEIPEDILNDILDVDERSRLEVYDDKLLMILRIPVHNPENGVPYSTVPLGLILNDDYTLVICQRKNELLTNIFNNRNKIFGSVTKMDFILSLCLLNSKLFHNYLKKINIQTNLIEEDLEKSTRNKELHRLLKMEKCLVYFTTSLRSNELLLAKLKNSRYVNRESYSEDLLEDVMIENRQAIDMANIYSDILSGMMDAFASVISNNLNIVMKQLTIVTIILMIPTLIASFFGMNIDNPFEHSPFAFIAVSLASLSLSVVGVFVIRVKKWG